MSEVTAVPLRPIAKGSLVKLWVGVGLIVAAAVGVAVASTAAQVRAAMPPSEYLAANGKRAGIVTTPSGLQYEVLTEGQGPKATAQEIALVRYDGRFVDGESFDATDQPVPLPVGSMIPGFSEGLQLMNRGSKYRFWIPPALAYGERGAPDPRTGELKIPPNSVLVFEVELVELAPASAMGMPGIGGR